MRHVAICLALIGILAGCGDEAREQNKRTLSFDADAVKNTPAGSSPIINEPGESNFPGQSGTGNSGGSNSGGNDDNGSVPGDSGRPLPELTIASWQDVTLFASGAEKKTISDVFTRAKLLIVTPDCTARDSCARWMAATVAATSQSNCRLLVVTDFVDHIRFWRGQEDAYYTSVGSAHLRARLRALGDSKAFVVDRSIALVSEGADPTAVATAACR